MIDWTGIAAVIAPVTTLLGVLGGYMLAGRNDDARDRRAAEHEIGARREAFAERLEEDRHTFQRDVLLGLQDELQHYVRNHAQTSMQDRKTIEEQGQLFIDSTFGEDGRLATVSVQRLRSRVLDDNLRAEIGEFMLTCTKASIALAEQFPGGKIPESEKAAALGRLGRLDLEIARAYEQLNVTLGAHLRREIDRRYLAVEGPPIGDGR
ncbi:MAG TPA: hypothetical protein VGG25_29285 [Streptosporangiaceae bacterium]